MSNLIKEQNLYTSLSKEDLQKLLDLPIDKQRYLFYNDNINKCYITTNVAEFDDKICFSETTMCKTGKKNWFYI